jgi:hypothetical protein
VSGGSYDYIVVAADEYARLLRCSVLPELGGTAVASIRPPCCEQFLAALVGEPSRQGDAESEVSIRSRTASSRMRASTLCAVLTTVDRVWPRGRKSTPAHRRTRHSRLRPQGIGTAR